MKTLVTTLLIISSLTSPFSAFALNEQGEKSVDQGKSAMSKESNGMMGMMQQMQGKMSMMQQMHGNMGEMMKNMSEPRMQEQMQKMHENMGQMMQQMQEMMGNTSNMGSMSGGMKGVEMPEMMKNSGKENK